MCAKMMSAAETLCSQVERGFKQTDPDIGSCCLAGGTWFNEHSLLMPSNVTITPAQSARNLGVIFLFYSLDV